MIIKSWLVRLGGALLFIVLARGLGLGELGLVSLYILIFNAADLLVENGVSDAIANNKVQSFKVGVIYTAFGASVAVAVVVLLWLTVWEDALKTNIYFLYMLTLHCVLNCYSFAMQGAYRMMGRFDVLAKKSVFVILSSLFISLIYFYYIRTADAILIYFITQSVLTAFYLYVDKAKKTILFSLNGINTGGEKHIRRFFGFKLASFSSGRILELLVYLKYGPIYLALLVIGSRVYNVFSYFIISVLQDYIFHLNNDVIKAGASRKSNAFESLLLTTSFITAPLFLGAAAVSEPLLDILIGVGKAGDSYLYLKFFCILGALEVAQYVLYSTVLSGTNSSIPTYVQLTKFFSIVLLYVVFDSDMPNVFILSSVVCSIFISAFYIISTMWTELCFSKKQVFILIGYYIAALLMYLLVVATGSILGDVSLFIKLIILILIGVVSYFLFLIMLNRADVKNRVNIILNKGTGYDSI